MSESLQSIRTRPRFTMESRYSTTECSQRLKTRLRLHKKFTGNVNAEVGTVQVETAQDNFWKPRLTVRFERNRESQGTIIRGVFGPSSAVWTFFMFLYFLFATALMTFASFWFVSSRLKMEVYTWAIIGTVVSILLLILTYAAARVGQKLALREMALLRKFAEITFMALEKK